MPTRNWFGHQIRFEVLDQFCLHHNFPPCSLSSVVRRSKSDPHTASNARWTRIRRLGWYHFQSKFFSGGLLCFLRRKLLPPVSVPSARRQLLKTNRWESSSLRREKKGGAHLAGYQLQSEQQQLQLHGPASLLRRYTRQAGGQLSDSPSLLDGLLQHQSALLSIYM